MDRVLRRAVSNGLMLFDLLIINLITSLLVYILQSGGSGINILNFSLFSISLTVVWYFLGYFFQLYDVQFYLHSTLYFRKLLIAKLLTWGLLLGYIGLVGGIKSHLLTFSIYYFLLVLLSICIRVLYLFIHHSISEQHGFNSRAIILGYNPTSKSLANYIEKSTGTIKVVGFIEGKEPINELSLLPIFTNVDETLSIAKRLDVNEIFSTIDSNDYPQINRLVEDAQKASIRFHFVSNLSAFIEKGMVVDHFYDFSVCSLRKDPLDDVGNRIVKRIFDVFVSSLVIIFILSWMFPLLAILIKLSSPGPVLFKQLRSGLADTPFYCFKFRTMRVNGQADSVQATKNDSRTTRIGSFLRKTSLDEFPQFINVLIGDMSIVGPRPHMIKHTTDFAQLSGQYMIRHFLKPGITGWAQVNGYRGEILQVEQLSKRIQCDIWYLENWSLLLDCKIVLLTFWGLFKKSENAY